MNIKHENVPGQLQETLLPIDDQPGIVQILVIPDIQF